MSKLTMIILLVPLLLAACSDRPEGEEERVARLQGLAMAAAQMPTQALEDECAVGAQYERYSDDSPFGRDPFIKNRAPQTEEWYKTVRQTLEGRSHWYIYADEGCKLTPSEFFYLVATQMASPPVQAPTPKPIQ